MRGRVKTRVVHLTSCYKAVNRPLVVARTAIKYARNTYGGKTAMLLGSKLPRVPHSVRICAQSNRSIKVQVSHAECQLWHLEPLNDRIV